MQKTTDQSESVVNHMMVNEPLKVYEDGEHEFNLTRDDLLGQKIHDDEYESGVTWSDLPGHKIRPVAHYYAEAFRTGPLS